MTLCQFIVLISFNLNLLECKYEYARFVVLVPDSFNLNLLECKCSKDYYR